MRTPRTAGSPPRTRRRPAARARSSQAEPDEAKRNATFKQILDIHKEHPYAIGVVGEKVAPLIAANNFRNIIDGFIADDTLRDTGLLNPQQFFFKK